MPIFQNPEVKKLMASHGLDPSSALRSIGLVGPSARMVPLEGDGASNLSFRLGESVGDLINNPKAMAPLGKAMNTISDNPRGSALLGALAGGGAGAAFGLGTDRNPALWGILGAGVGGLGGYGLNKLIQSLSQRRRERDMAWQRLLESSRHPIKETPQVGPLYHQKFSFYVNNGQDPMTYIQTKLFEDNSLPTGEKTQMIMQLRDIPPQSLITLAGLLRTAVGGAIGYLVGKFLLRFGGTGTALATGLGGLVGTQMGGPRPSYNMLGQEVDTQRDFFGNPRFVF